MQAAEINFNDCVEEAIREEQGSSRLHATNPNGEVYPISFAPSQRTSDGLMIYKSRLIPGKIFTFHRTSARKLNGEGTTYYTCAGCSTIRKAISDPAIKATFSTPTIGVDLSAGVALVDPENPKKRHYCMNYEHRPVIEAKMESLFAGDEFLHENRNSGHELFEELHQSLDGENSNFSMNQRSGSSSIEPELAGPSGLVQPTEKTSGVNLDCLSSAKTPLKLEVCVDSVESALNAINGGAHRIELCSALQLGGLTPTIGLLHTVKAHAPSSSVFCMLRCRDGDFVYSAHEMEEMLYDLQMLGAAGADGFVFGALKRDGSIDEMNCAKVIGKAQAVPVTFHRAFDVCSSWKTSLGRIFNLGFKRILTSGQGNNVTEGMPRLAEIVTEANQYGNLTIMAGAGVTESNVATLYDLGLREFHSSASIVRESNIQQNAKSKSSEVKMGSGSTDERKVACEKRVRNMRLIIDGLSMRESRE